jgi:hypothetical protein
MFLFKLIYVILQVSAVYHHPMVIDSHFHVFHCFVFVLAGAYERQTSEISKNYLQTSTDRDQKGVVFLLKLEKKTNHNFTWTFSFCWFST